MELVKVVDSARRDEAVEALGKKGRVHQVRDRRPAGSTTDLIVDVGEPAAELQAARPGGRPGRVRRAARESSSRHDLPEHVEAVGAVAGAASAPLRVPAPMLGYRGEKFLAVCFCEDQGRRRISSTRLPRASSLIELSKRYTTVTMGPCQGRLCHVNSIRVYCEGDRASTRTRSARRRPGHRTHRSRWGSSPATRTSPAKRTSLHHRHNDLGGEDGVDRRLARATLVRPGHRGRGAARAPRRSA